MSFDSISTNRISTRTITFSSIQGTLVNTNVLAFSSLSTFLPESAYGAFSIPWNAMQTAGGIIVEAGTWIHKGLLSTNEMIFNSIEGRTALINSATISSLRAPIISSVYVQTNTAFANTHFFTQQFGSVQNVNSSFSQYISVGQFNAGVFNIASTTTNTLNANNISAGVLSLSSITLGQISFIDTATSAHLPLYVSSETLFLNNVTIYKNIVSTADLVSTTNSLLNQITITSNSLDPTIQLSQTNSTVAGNFTIFQNSVSSLSTATGNTINSLSTSITQGLGSSGYISSFSLTSTINGLGSYGYVSSASVISPTQLTSSLAGLGGLNYVSSTQLTSSIQGLGSTGYLSSPPLIFSTNSVKTSTLQMLDNRDNSFYTLTLSSSYILANGQFISSIGDVTSALLTSSLAGLGGLGYVSSTQLTSSITGLGSAGYISSSGLSNSLTSSITGLASAGYISSTQLTSSLAGLGGLNYISSTQLASSLAGLGGLNYISSTQLTSSLAGLGGLGYVSSTQLTSSITGFGSAGYISSSGLSNSLTSSITGLASAGYISSTQLTSSLAGLGGLNYISSTQLASSLAGLGGLNYISSTQLTSSLAGLGRLGYVSSTQLTSSITGLGSAGYISSSGLSNALTSSITGLASSGYISSTQLTSSLTGLGTLGYLSAINSASGTISSLSTSQIHFNTNQAAFRNLRLVAVGSNTTLQTTTGLGSSWSSPATNTFTQIGIAVATNGSNLWVAAGSNNPSIPGGTLRWSVDGINWANATSGAFSNYANKLFYNGSNLWIAGGDATGSLKYSVTGKVWFDATTNFNNNSAGFRYDIAYNGSTRYVACGRPSVSVSESLQYSSDGITWTNATSGAISSFSVAYGNNVWVAVGSNQIVYSSDGASWTNSALSLGGRTMYSVTFGNGYFVACGDGQGVLRSNAIYYSTDGINWTPTQAGGGGLLMRSVKYLTSSIFLAVGSNNVSITSSVQISYNNGSNFAPINPATGIATVFDIAGYPSTFFSTASGTLTLSTGRLQYSTLGVAFQGQNFIGNSLRVDTQYGNDAAATLDTTFPFATLASALNAAAPAQAILLSPGTHTFTEPLFLHEGINIRGTTMQSTRLQLINASTSITGITMGPSTCIEDLSILMTTSTNTVNLTAIEIPNSNNANSRIRSCFIQVNSAACEGTATNDTTGVLISGTGQATTGFTTLKDVTINVSGNGNGFMRGLYFTGSGATTTVRDTNILITPTPDTSATGFLHGVELGGATSATLFTSILNSQRGSSSTTINNDAVCDSSSRLVIGQGTTFTNKSYSGPVFSTLFTQPLLSYTVKGYLSSATASTPEVYLWPGFGIASSSYPDTQPSYYTPTQSTIIASFAANIRLAPTVGTSTIISLLVNDAVHPTPITLGYGGNESSIKQFTTATLGIGPSDRLSVFVSTTGGATNKTADLSVQLGLF